MGFDSRRKVEYLIVDTSAFINNVALQELGNNLITVPQVVDEIKSKRQLRRLVVLPYDLKIKEAFQENIRFVSEFSKQTGDYKSLSATDINVIALTYQLEKEQKGIDHLNVAPIHKPKIESTSTIPDDLKNISGFYLPKKIKKKKITKCGSEDSDDSSEYCSAEEGDFENQNELQNDEDENLETEKFSEENKKNCDTPRSNITIEINEGENQGKEKNEIEFDTGDEGSDEDKEDEEDEEDEDDENDEDDEDNWITPGNIEKIKKQTSNAVNEDLENVSVACLTTDFAMQNVLKQIGLQVLSLDGKLIKQLRTFILRCYGCFKTTSVMTKVFCPNCGNKTLKKVAVSINEDGSQHLHINFRKPLTARGKKLSPPLMSGVMCFLWILRRVKKLERLTRLDKDILDVSPLTVIKGETSGMSSSNQFSVPHFKGGKHSNNPIICEDQPQPQQRPSRLTRTKNDPLNDDYIAGFSPFVTRDINSKSAMLGIKPYVEMKHWMRKNPNESRRRKK